MTTRRERRAQRRQATVLDVAADVGDDSGAADPRVPIAAGLFFLSRPLFPLHLLTGDPLAYWVRVPWDGLAAAALLLWLGLSARRRQQIRETPPALLAGLAAVLLVNLLSAAVNRDPGRPMVVEGHALLSLGWLSLTFLLFSLPVTPAAARALTRVVAHLGGIAAILAIATPRRPGGGSFLAPIGNANTVASLLLVALAATLTIALGSARRPLRLAEVGYLGVVLTAGLVRTGSRAGLVAVAVVILLAVAVAGGRRLGTLGRHAVVAAVVAGTLATAALGVWIAPRVVDRMGGEIRWQIWRGTMDMIADQPLLGVGPGRFLALYPPYRTPEYAASDAATDVTLHPHSHWLEVASESGLLGLGAWLGLLLAVAACGRRTWAPHKLAAPLALGLLLLQNTVDQNLSLDNGRAILWMLLGLAVAGVDSPARRTAESRSLLPALVGTGLAAILIYAAVLRPLSASVLAFRAMRVRSPTGSDLARLDRARSDQPHDPRYHWFYAGLATHLRGPEAGIEGFERLRQIAPDYSHVHYNLGSLYAEVGDETRARTHLSREIELHPRRSEARRALERLGRPQR